MSYRIELTREARRHFADLTARQRSTVRDALIGQLGHQPTTETRNRKLLRPNTMAGYRLRVGNLRVYYDVLGPPEEVVIIKAIGLKIRSRVLIGGEEIEL